MTPPAAVAPWDARGALVTWARYGLYGGAGALLAVPMLSLAALVVAGALGTLFLVGLPVLAASLLLVRLVGAGERKLLARTGLRAVEPPAHETLTGWEALRSVLTSPVTGRVLGWVALRAVTGTVAAASVVLGVLAASALVAASFVDGWFRWGGWVSSAGWSAAGYLPLAALAVLTAAALTAGTGWTQAQAASLLGASPAEAAEAARAAAADRARRTQLARDLHDSLGHNLTVALLQITAAERLLDTDPEAARRAISVGQRETRAALSGLDRVMAVLQGRRPEPGEAPAATDVAGLVSTLREAGLDIQLSLDDLQGLPTEIAHAVYRVVQEAGTNVLRHAPDAATRITVQHHPPSVQVDVVNDAPPQPGAGGRLGPGSGQGLAGLRILCRQLDGDLTAGTTSGGGWRVRATLRTPARA